MALDIAAICDLYDQFPEFSMPPQRVHAEGFAISTLTPSTAYLPSHDCIYGKRRRHSPNCVLRLDCEGSHGQSMLQALNSKHTVRHREQISHGEIVELNGDMEYEQIC
jgi:hypothetical protein